MKTAPKTAVSRSTLTHRLLLCLMLAATFFLSLDATFLKNRINYDESITFLAATCHQAEYALAVQEVTVRTAVFWQSMIQQVGHPFCFDQIQADLARYDVHPPLYFWLLHLWFLLVGAQLWSGSLLSIFIALLTAASIGFVAKRLLNNRTEVLITLLTFCFSPTILLISREARHYNLLALWTVWLVYFTAVSVDPGQTPTRKQLLGVFLFAAAGMLTHYQFILVIGGCGVWGLLRVWGVRLRRLTAVWLALTAGTGLAFFIHPHIFSAFAQQATYNPERGWVIWLERLQNVGVALANFSYLLPLLLLILLPLVLIHGRKDGSLLRVITRQDWGGGVLLFFALWLGGALISQYLLFLSPLHAMVSPRYLGMMWPFLIVVPAFIGRFLRYRSTLMLYLMLIPLLFAIAYPIQMRLFRLPDLDSAISGQPLIVVDSPMRGSFLQLVTHFPPEADVIVALPETLQTYPWPNMNHPSIHYLSDRDLKDQEVQQALLAAWSNQSYFPTSVERIQTINSEYDWIRLIPQTE